MERRIINPWSWQDQYGFVQANALTGAQRLLMCAGQTAIDDDGHVAHVGDMAGQISMALDNLETVLKQADLDLSNVVRLNYYVVDMDAFFAAFSILTDRLAAANCRPASTLLGISRLAFPELLVEIEATAAV